MNNPTDSLTPAQRETLIKFKVSVSDISRPQFDDYYYLRWLKARHFDLVKAESMLRHHMRWRQLNKVDTILQDFHPPETLSRYSTGGQFGRDKEGAIVYIEPFGNQDMKGLLMSVKKRDMVRSKIWLMEEMSRLFALKSAEDGKPIKSMVIIFDAENIGPKHLWKPGIDVVTESMAMFEEHYPETLKKTYIVNAPKSFSFIFKLVKPFLGEETKKKIEIWGSNFKEVLLNDIAADQLPARWGGTCTEAGDPRCPSVIKPGGPVPEKCYFNRDCVRDLGSFTEVTVGKGSSLHVPLPDVTRGTTIQWRFLTDNCDIAFGVFRKTSSEQTMTSQMEEVYPVMRVNSHLVMEDGQLVCEAPGHYILSFDNSYSRLKSKKLHYTVKTLHMRQNGNVPCG